MTTPFTKMHGLGNDFIVFDAINHTVKLDPRRLRCLADRHFGIGCDQVLLVESSGTENVDFHYRIFNADGGEVEQCGNGARCFARFVRDKGLTDKDNILVETMSGVSTLQIQPDGQITVDMGVPQFDPRDIPFDAPARAPIYDLDVGGQTVSVGVVSVGNPHAVQQVADLERAPVANQGPLIEQHPRFPKRVNAGFMQIIDRDHINLRVYERGAGETLACGSGACAAVIVGRQQGLLNDKVAVNLPGGCLTVHWEGENKPVWSTGPASTVFKGEINLDQL
jgi:diaminopimelate epimerase